MNDLRQSLNREFRFFGDVFYVGHERRFVKRVGDGDGGRFSFFKIERNEGLCEIELVLLNNDGRA